MRNSSKEIIAELLPFYQDQLMNKVIPFYMEYALDRQYGGYTTCLDDDGTLLSGDKYLWSQGRGVWTFSALYNRIEKDPKWLEVAELGVRFLREHGRDSQGRWVYRTSREGKVIDGPISIFSDCFAVYGLTEFFRATGDRAALELAVATYAEIRRRIAEPGFDAVAPQVLPKGWRIHAIPMIMLEISQELGDVAPELNLQPFIDDCVHQIMDLHLRPEYHVLLENLTVDGQEIQTPEGRVVNPGHGIESMWFVMHQARRRNDQHLINRAVEAIRWMLEIGWDQEYGGLFLAVDRDGGPAAFPNWDKKAWWPHTESMYALLLAYELTGEEWCLDWYWRVHRWAVGHLVSSYGDWYQRLDRQGRPIKEVIALPVKDPFHLPRMLILGIQCLKRIASDESLIEIHFNKEC
ncbi:MAG: AGE family epimerase/isomerase [Candidatus Hydrothermae bacterium]|nr:AGE family epimerase/isomerase [Candidatus Hydrothermae bacterium]